MSTRCQVKVITMKDDLMLYHHCDGYPEGVGYCLLKLMDRFEDTKGFWSADDIVNDMIKKGYFEITFGNHSDIEYLYEMDFLAREVRCYAVNNWNSTMEIEERIPLKYNKDKDVNVDEEIFKKGE